MKDKLKFTEMGDTGFMESENFIFTKTELEYIFEDKPVIGTDIHKKIKEHEHISIELEENRDIKVHFWVVRGTDDKWMMNVTMPVNAGPILPEKIKELVFEKEPMKANNK